jgi:hypothetical protein
MIFFVGDRPSSRNTHSTIAFIGTPSYKTLSQWVDYLGIARFGMVNSYDHAHRVEICRLANTYEAAQFIALGNNASKVLKELGIKHFKLPHPSPKNRQMNDKQTIVLKLNACKEWLGIRN